MTGMPHTATTSVIDGCQQTWPSDQPTRSDDTHRQHRCQLNPNHAGSCICRYCGKGRRS